MAMGIMGRKIGMTQVFDDQGRLIPVTVVQADPNIVVQRRTKQRDGYEAVQVTFGPARPNKVNRPLKGHFDRAGVQPRRRLREFRVSSADEYEAGQEITVDMFEEGHYVDVAGVSLGKGFAGSIKRHGFSRGPMSHGSRYHRGTGALGGSATPGRVFKGRKMPGRMGGRRVKARGLEVIRVDADKNLLLIKGSVPGPRGAYVAVQPTTVAGKKAR